MNLPPLAPLSSPPFPSVVWESNTWALGQRLGQGKFAVVHEATCREVPGRRLAAKIVNSEIISKWAQAQLKTELEVWQTLDHRHVCKLYGSVREGKYLILFLEHAAGGELFERIIARETVFVEKEASRFMRQLLSAVSYLHDCGVIHRDLKPENLLLDSTADDASLRVADFGACKVVTKAATPSAYASTPCGSLGYAAPEQMRQQLYERQCDLWSAGVIAYVLLSGCMPFDPSTYAGSSFELNFPEELFATVSPDAIHFIRQLLQIDPQLRPDASTALSHRWLTTEAPLPSALPTPRLLRGLCQSGKFDDMFSHASDIWLYSCATTPVGNIPGNSRRERRYSVMTSGGDESQQQVEQEEEQQQQHQQQQAQLQEQSQLDHEELEVPILSLPPHVRKRLKKGEPESMPPMPNK
mmetsp:Transcript_24262/g.56094  ORF Transcript_24262/g.56094 Transcript_24262/m.56094 type:complete len:412 (+) Transcript_24262:172-1407(+)